MSVFFGVKDCCEEENGKVLGHNGDFARVLPHPPGNCIVQWQKCICLAYRLHIYDRNVERSNLALRLFMTLYPLFCNAYQPKPWGVYMQDPHATHVQKQCWHVSGNALRSILGVSIAVIKPCLEGLYLFIFPQHCPSLIKKVPKIIEPRGLPTGVKIFSQLRFQPLKLAWKLLSTKSLVCYVSFWLTEHAFEGSRIGTILVNSPMYNEVSGMCSFFLPKSRLSPD